MNTFERIVRMEDCLISRGFFSAKENIDLWPLIRIQLYFANLPNTNSVQKKRATLMRIILAVIGIAKEIVADRANNNNLKKCDIFFSTHSTCRVICHDKRCFDTFVDPISHWVSELNNHISASIEEIPVNWEFRIPRYQGSCYVGRRMSIMGILAKLSFHNRAVPCSSKAIAILKCSAKQHNLFFDHIKFLKKLRYFNFVKQYYKKLFIRLQPKLIFVCTYYGISQMAMVMAARELSIPVVDLQHGVHGDYHIAYARWPKVGPYISLPNYFWCWSSGDVQNIKTWGGKHHRAIHGGNIFLQYVNSYPDMFKLSSDLHDKIQTSRCKKKILVTLQPFDKSNSEVILDMILKEGALGKGTDIFWLIRLHPAMAALKSEICKKMASIANRLDIVHATECILARLLELADLHVTSSSSVILEAEDYGLRSLSICRELDYYKDQQANGILILMHEHESLTDAINRAVLEGRLDKKRSDCIGKLALNLLLSEYGLQDDKQKYL